MGIRFPVITCTRDSMATLPETVRSVQGQGFPGYEHIFVDGECVCGPDSGELASFDEQYAVRRRHLAADPLARLLAALKYRYARAKIVARESRPS